MLVYCLFSGFLSAGELFLQGFGVALAKRNIEKLPAPAAIGDTTLIGCNRVVPTIGIIGNSGTPEPLRVSIARAEIETVHLARDTLAAERQIARGGRVFKVLQLRSVSNCLLIHLVWNRFQTIGAQIVASACISCPLGIVSPPFR